MLGLSRKQARERFDDIIAFAELEEFVDLKLKNYSSGMYVRLAFADRGPGRRRHPADRRGARGRRRRVPAEVLRRVHPPAARRAARSCSSPTTWARWSASATARCCSSAGGWSTSAIPASIARQYNHLNFHRDRDEAASRERRRVPRARRAGRRRSSTPGSSRRSGERDRHRRPGRALRRPDGGAVPRRRRGSDLRRQARRTKRASSLFADQHRRPRRSRPGASRPGTDARCPHPVRELAGSRPLPPGRHGRPRRPRRRRPRRARRSSIIVLADRPGGGAGRPAHTFEIERGVSVMTRHAVAATARPRSAASCRRFVELTHDAGADRVQAPLLRLGARLRLVADAAAAVLRRAVPVLHPDRQGRQGRPALRRVPADRDRAVELLLGGDRELRHLPAPA